MPGWRGGHRAHREAAGRMADRRQREAAAPRLAAMVPALQGLRLEVSERNSSISRPEHNHTRHVVVATAPALFILPCHDSQCKDGGHDLTQVIMSALRQHQERFEGESACSGSIGSATCARILTYVGVATYASPPKSS